MVNDMSQTVRAGISIPLAMLLYFVFILQPSVYCSSFDPCQRQPFKATCESPSKNRLTNRSQFVLRFYKRGDECVSYPFALCRGDQEHATLFKRKEDCERACFGPSTKQLVILHQPTVNTVQPLRKVSSAQVFAKITSAIPMLQTTSGNRLTTHAPKLTKCQERRMLAGQRNSETHVQTAMIYKCTEDGAFEQVQCHEPSSTCWCVNEEGYELPNTRTYGGSVRPNCEGTSVTQALPTATSSLATTTVMGPPRVHSCDTGSPALDQNGRPVDCFHTACPSGFKCSMRNSDAICCPDNDQNKVAANLISSVSACELPKDRGSCNKFELRFYFNTEFKECKYFFYGGCGGNANNFKDLSQCEKTCGKTVAQKMLEFDARPRTPLAAVPPSEDRCEQTKDAGPCAGRFIRWYWNGSMKTCEVFVYGGCKGNGNNFASREACIDACAPSEQTITTRASTSNVTVKSLGTETTFAPRLSTTARISAVTILPVAQLPVTPVTQVTKSKEGPCQVEQCPADCIEITNSQGCLECMCPEGAKTSKEIEEKKQTGSSEATTNVTVKPAKPKEQEMDKCLLPLDVGPCDGPIQARWGYSQKTKRCEKFNYTGCGGNMNHFYSLKECSILCAKHILSITKEQLVDLNPEFVPTSNQSEQRHESASQKLIVSLAPPRIQEDVDPICSLPRDSGPCINFMTKWFYNAVTGRCERFQYGSCGGNSNNFDSEETCNARCVSGAQSMGIALPDICAQEKDSGPCQGYNVRYYYNPRNMRCELFVYGGCGGNSNNFDSKQACEVTCPVYERMWTTTNPKFFATQSVPSPEPNLPKKSEPVLPLMKKSNDNIILRDEVTSNVPLVTTTTAGAPVSSYGDPKPYTTAKVQSPGLSDEQASLLGYEAQVGLHLAGGEQAPLCPNGLPAKTDTSGQAILCLPGKSQCPPSSSCYFNGLDFFCCPMEEIAALPLGTEEKNMLVIGSQPTNGYGSRVKRQSPYMSSPEFTAPSMLPNLPLESPLKAPSLGTPYDAQVQMAGANANHRSQMVNAIFGPTSQYDYSIPQPPTLGSLAEGSLRPKHCDLPSNQGPCKGSHLRFYYDASMDDCRLFYYGGCQGNRNNFATMDLCRKECVKKPKVISCPGDLQPLGGINNPIACGSSAGGIECPEGFTCSSGMFKVCCPSSGADKNLPKGAPEDVPPPPRLMPPPLSVESPTGNEISEVSRTALQASPVKASPMFNHAPLGQVRSGTFTSTPLNGQGVQVQPVQVPSMVQNGYAQPIHQSQPGLQQQLIRLSDAMMQQHVVPNSPLTYGKNAALIEQHQEIFQPIATQPLQGKSNSLCQLPPDTGHPCDPRDRRVRGSVSYYFDAKSHECMVLDYKGCGGNENRFSSRNNCYRVCHGGLKPLAP